MSARRLGLMLLCAALGLCVWPARIETHFPHIIDGLEYWGPALLLPIGIGVLSQRDWVQRTFALAAGEVVATMWGTDLAGTGYLVLVLPPFLVLGNAIVVLTVAGVLGLRKGLRS